MNTYVTREEADAYLNSVLRIGEYREHVRWWPRGEAIVRRCDLCVQRGRQIPGLMRGVLDYVYGSWMRCRDCNALHPVLAQRTMQDYQESFPMHTPERPVGYEG